MRINKLAAPAGMRVETAVEGWIQEWIAEHIPEATASHSVMTRAGTTTLDVRAVTLPSGSIRHVFFEVGEFSEGPEAEPPPLDHHQPIQPEREQRRVWPAVSAGVIVVVGLLAWNSRACHANGGWPWLPVFVGVLLFVAWLKMFEVLKSTELAGVSLFGLGLGVLTWLVVWWGFPGAQVYLENHTGKDVELSRNGGGWVGLANESSRLVTWPRRNGEVRVRDSASKAELDRHPIGATTAGPYILNVLGAHTYYTGALTYAEQSPLLPTPPGTSWESAVSDRWIEARVNYLFELPPASITVQTKSNTRHLSQERSYLLRYSVHQTLADMQKYADTIRAALPASGSNRLGWVRPESR